MLDETTKLELDWYFPQIEQTVAPLGGRVLVQLKRVRGTTPSGFALPPDVVDFERSNMQIAKVLAFGPLAYKKRETMEPWPEGAWVKIGDFVRCPMHGGDKESVEMPDGNPVVLATFNDYEMISLILTDPLKMKTYIN